MSRSRPAAPRAVLFDLDGVLVDSFESWYAVVNAAARRFDRPAIGREVLAAHFGQGPEDDARLFYPGHDAAEIQAVYEAEMPAHVARMQVGRESHAVLDELGRRGVGRGVATNTQASLARLVLEACALRGRLDAWAGVGGGLAEKPAPDLLLAVLDRLAVPPSAAVLVGDTHYDEEAARAAGTGFVRFDLRAGGSLRRALAGVLGG